MPKNLAPTRVGPCPSLHYPPPLRNVHLWGIFFALPAMNGPLPAELKFRENTDQSILVSIGGWKGQNNGLETAYLVFLLLSSYASHLSHTLHEITYSPHLI